MIGTSKKPPSFAAVIALGATLLGSLLSIAAAEVWAAKSDHERRITTIEVERSGDHELLIEVRQDVKEILSRAKPQ